MFIVLVWQMEVTMQVLQVPSRVILTQNHDFNLPADNSANVQVPEEVMLIFTPFSDTG